MLLLLSGHILSSSPKAAKTCVGIDMDRVSAPSITTMIPAHRAPTDSTATQKRQQQQQLQSSRLSPRQVWVKQELLTWLRSKSHQTTSPLIGAAPPGLPSSSSQQPAPSLTSNRTNNTSSANLNTKPGDCCLDGIKASDSGVEPSAGAAYVSASTISAPTTNKQTTRASHVQQALRRAQEEHQQELEVESKLAGLSDLELAELEGQLRSYRAQLAEKQRMACEYQAERKQQQDLGWVVQMAGAAVYQQSEAATCACI